jgi:UDP-4-amino-4,6-dideoxy-N-acetyl-beta-L-altrosamine transaminase
MKLDKASESNSILPYGRQTITESDIQAVVETLRSDFLTQGPKIHEFEEKFAKYVGAKYASAVANGTAALHLAVLALGIKPGQKVITTPITFAASANCILYAGGIPDFVDIDPNTALIDLDLVESKLSSSRNGEYAGIIPVDFAGCPVDLEKVRSIADKFNLWILEDACHAPGGYFTDSKSSQVKCGSALYSDAAIFSFHPVKHIATGEGGMVTTNNSNLNQRIQLLRTHGITKNPKEFINPLESDRVNYPGYYYEMQELGFNYRISDITASLGVSQLARAEQGLARRREIARMYDEAFANSSFVRPIHNASKTPGHAYHLYVVRVHNRDKIHNMLRDKNIFTQVHYIPVHLQPYYQKLGWRGGVFPHAEKYYKEALSLPLYPAMSNQDVGRVVEEMNYL